MGELEKNMKSNSQAGQDLFVLSQFPQGYKGVFLDIGCSLPVVLNNTLLLEEHGWNGYSFDIIDYSKEWKKRNTRFICADVLKVDFLRYISKKEIDYLSLDIEGDGCRYAALKRLIDYGFTFKVITIEHDSYRGFTKTEKEPQRKLLKEQGYTLINADVKNNGLIFEDWWIK
jgi:hypothetical protein